MVTVGTVWHNLLIYYLVEKNNIIKKLVNMDYIFDEDIEEIKKWSIEKVKKSLQRIGRSIRDDHNCPWCIHYNKSHHYDYKCEGCGYAERHGNCLTKWKKEKDIPNYQRVLEAMIVTGKVSRTRDIPHDVNICSIHEIQELSEAVHNTFKILSNILP